MHAARPLLAIFTLSAGILGWASPVLAQGDPFYGRVRGLTTVPFPSFQGADCLTVEAPPSLVWRLLVSPEPAGAWLVADVDGAVPRGTHWRRGLTASKDDVLTLDVDTEGGPRRTEITVVAEIPGQLLSLLVTKDEHVIARGMERLTFTFLLEDAGEGRTDLWLALHFDPDSPLGAALSGLGTRRLRQRRERMLLVVKALVEAAARMPAPPLHGLPPASHGN